MSIRKNAAGQGLGFTLVNATTGAIVTGATVTVVRCIDGTFAAATGTVTESSGHYWFTMSQADTNGDDISFLFTATGAVPVEKTIVTTKSTAVGYEAIDWGAVNAPTTTVGLTGTTIATSQVVASVTGAVGSVTGAVGSVTGLTASNLDATVSSRLAAASYTAPDNVGIAAIQAKTDQMVFGVANTLNANIEYVNAIQVKGAGTTADPWNPV